MKFGFKGIHHVGVSVPSIAEAKAFYVHALGFDQLSLPGQDTG